jgi:hypothetical protein
MDTKTVNKQCHQYFHLVIPKSAGEGLLLGVKILSYASIILPLIAGVALGASEVILWYRNRKISQIDPSGSSVIKTNQAGLRRLRSERSEEVVLPSEPPIKPDPQSSGYQLRLMDPDKLPKVSTKLLFQLQADEFGKNSEKEGLSVLKPLSYVLSYLKERRTQNHPICLDQDELIREIETAHSIATDLDKSMMIREVTDFARVFGTETSGIDNLAASFDYAKVITKRIQESKESQQACLIPGGWVGAPAGHAIYFELIPESDKKATLRIFNTGAGISEHPQYQVGVKEKVGYTDWKGISFDKLLDPDFAQIIKEMQTEVVILGKHTEYGFQDIYFGLKEFLNVKNEQISNEKEVLDPPLMQAQRAGTCSYRSLLAFVKSKMSLQEFKRFKCDLLIQSLTTHIASTVKVDKIQWRLVKKSTMQVSRKVDKLFRDQIVGDEYLKQAQQSLKTVSEWVESNQSAIYTKKKIDTNCIYTPFVNESNLFTKKPKRHNDRDESLKTQTNLHSKISDPLSQIQKFKLNDPKIFTAEITQICHILKTAYENGEFSATNFAALEVIKNISILTSSNGFWKEVTCDKIGAENLINHFNTLSELFFQTCFKIPQSRVVFAEKVYALIKINHIQGKFATSIDPNIKLRIGYDLGGTSEFQFHNERMVEEWQYMSWDSEDMFNLKFNFEKNKLTVTLLKYAPFPFAEFVVNNPDLIKAIRNDNPQFDSLEIEKRTELILISPRLPDWMKNLLQMKLRALYLMLAPVAPLTHENATLQFTLRQWDSEIIAELDGINENSFNALPDRGRGGAGYYKAQTSINNLALALMTFEPKKHEKDLIGKTIAQDKRDPLSEAAFKELAHLFSNPATRIIETVEYFLRYPEKLQDSDYQQLFQRACFINFEKFNEGFAPNLSNFVRSRLEYYEGQNDIKTQVFFLRMCRYFNHFNAFKDLLPNEQPWLNKLLKREDISPEEKSLLFVEQIALFDDKKTLSKDELILLLIGNTWVNGAPIGDNWSDPKSVWQNESAIQKYYQKILELICPQGEPNQALLNQIYQAVKGEKSSFFWKLINNSVFESSNGDIYDPLIGKMSKAGEQTYLPFDIRQNLDFSRLFPEQSKAILIWNPEYVRKRFLFVDKNGHKILVSKGNNIIDIHKEIGGVMHLLISQHGLVWSGDYKEIKCAIESRHLVNLYDVWLSEQTFLFTEKDSNQVIYKAKLTEFIDQDPAKFIIGNYYTYTVNEVRRNDNALLGKSSPLFSNIEATSYIQEWYDSEGKLLEIELPRFKLSFKPDPLDRTLLECVQFSGWHLSIDQSIPALGSCDYHLVLEGPNGRKKIIIPDQELKSSQKKEVLAPRFERNQELDIGKIVTFTYSSYELDSKGKLHASSRAAYFHLIETLIAHQEYDLAASYLKKHGEKLSAYSSEEQKFLERIYKIENATGDQSGEQLSLALYTAFLLTTNAVQSKEAVEALPKIYRNYLIHYKNITTLKLTREDELRILKNLLAIEYSPSFYTRLRELDPNYASHLETPNSTKLQMKESIGILAALKKIKFDPGNIVPLTPESEKKALITRSYEQILRHLPDYMHQADKGTKEQKKWLKNACIFLTNHEKDEHCALGFLIRDVLKHPKKIKFTSNTDKKEIKRGWNQTISKYENTLTMIRPNGKSSSTINKTPPHFRLDKPKKPFPQIPFSFDLISIKSIAERSSSDFFNKIQNDFTKDFSGELKAWLGNQQLETSNQNHILSQEWNRLNEDLIEYEKIPQKTTYKLRVNIEKISESLQTGSEEEAKAIIKIESEMLRLANRLPALEFDQIRHQLRMAGGIQKTITLESILLSFAQQNPLILQNINEFLDKDDFHQLYTLTARYLLLSTNFQQRERCLKLCEKIGKLNEPSHEIERTELEKQLTEEWMAQRRYDPKTHPAYLVFEQYADVLIREDQITKLNEFFSGSDSNPVMEMIMGSGKSKILLPLLGLLRADGKDLSLLIVPAPLFESVSQDTQNILKGAFSKSLRSLHFDRNTTFTERSLEEIRDILKDIIVQKECLMMTSKSVQSLLLKFIEYADKMAKTNDLLNDQMFLMEEIIRLLNSCGNPLIDEADTVLNVLHEVSFSLGNRSSPNRSDVHLIGEFYNLLYSDSKLKAIARLESDPFPDAKAPPLTEEIFHQRLKRPLAEAFLDRLKVKGLNDALIIKQLAELFKNENSHQLILDYICREQSNAPESQKLYKSLPTELQNIFALASEEVSHLLPHTLLKMSDEKYGLDDGVIAIPYSAVNTPSHGSLFANPYITMNYTYQIHSKNGINQKMINDQVQKLKKQADEEITESGGTKTITDTDAWKLFCVLKGEEDIPLSYPLSKQQLKTLERQVNRSPELKSQVVANNFLPHLDLFENKLSCNPIGFTSLFQKVSGFTGTLWNAGSMHRKITPRPVVGTDSRTLSLLWKMSHKNDNVQVIKKALLDEMIDELHRQEFDMISDAGGYFKEGGNLSIARILALKLGKSVVFYSSNGDQTITDGKKEQPLSESKLTSDSRVTFLDQSHTTGADVPQKGLAIGIVTVGRNMLLRDLLQSVWRLRGLEKGQKVKFIIDEEVETIIKQKLNLTESDTIGFPQILRFIVENQSRQQGEDNFKAYKQQILGFSQNLIINVLLNKQISSEEKIKAIDLLRSTWIKPTNLSPAVVYGASKAKVESIDVIMEEKRKCEVFLDKIAASFPWLDLEIKEVRGQINGLAETTKSKVPRLVTSSLGDDAETVEVETEVEAQNHIEIEQDNQFEKIELGVSYGKLKKRSDIGFRDFENDVIPFFPIEKQMRREPTLKGFAKYFKGIYISMNVLEWNKETKKINACKLLGPYRTPFHHLKVDEDDVLLISNSSNETQGIVETDLYYNLYVGFKDPSKKPSEKAFEKIVKLKFLNGECSYNQKEAEFLEKWLGEAGAEKMLRLFFRHILNNQPDKAANYSGSKLQKVFNKLQSRK